MAINDYGKQHIPMKFTWEMTERCNLNCKMCYSIDKNSCNKKEMSTEEIFKMLKILESNNVLYLFLDGGEPLLRKDFFEILPEVTKRFCTWISTNGTLINAQVAKKLKENNVNTVFVSLHGSNAEIHEKITQTNGSFNKTIEGIKNLISNNVATMTTFQVSKLNKDNIEEYVNICKELKVRKINFLRPYPLGNGIENYKKYGLTASEYEVFTYKVKEICEKYDMDFGHSFGKENHNCCIQAFSCDSEGKLMNCPYLRFMPRLGDILTDDILKVWNSEQALKIRNYSDNKPSECIECTNYESCRGGCTAGRILEGMKIHKDIICGREKIYIKRNPNIKVAYPRVDLDLQIKMFLYNPQSGKEFVANTLTTFIWEILEEEKTEEEIFNALRKVGINIDKNIVDKIRKTCDLMKQLGLLFIEER